MAYEQYRRWIIDSFPGTGRGPVLDLVAGSFAGGTAVLFTYPLDLVRTKLAYQVPPPPHTHTLSLSLSPRHTHTEEHAYITILYYPTHMTYVHLV